MDVDVPVFNNDKYQTTGETKVVEGRVVYRIKALRDIDWWHIKKGDLGGFVKSELNLDTEDDSWIQQDGCVKDTARVEGHSCIFGKSVICGKTTLICNKSMVYDSHISDNAIIDNSLIESDVRIYDDVQLQDVHVEKHCLLSGDVKLKKLTVKSYAIIRGSFTLAGEKIVVYGNETSQLPSFDKDYSERLAKDRLEDFKIQNRLD